MGCDGRACYRRGLAAPWEAASILCVARAGRTAWRSFILRLLFYKRICDVWSEEHTRVVATYLGGLRCRAPFPFLRAMPPERGARDTRARGGGALDSLRVEGSSRQ